MATETIIEDRRVKIRDILSLQGFIALTDLARQTGFSESTIRRDLEALEEQGIARRTHGGAVYVRENPLHVLAFAQREQEMVAEKQAIAAALAQQITPGATVIIDGGTTCFHAARALAGKRLSIITNSVPAASILSSDLATEVTLIGGYLYPRTGAALGPAAQQQLAQLHATQLVFSCAGVTHDGIFNSNQMIADVQRQMMKIADQVILVADHHKFGRSAVTKVCGLDEVDMIITDSRARTASLQWLDALGAKAVFAEVSP